jgi:molybdenum cofactor cytidylyltransferase
VDPEQRDANGGTGPGATAPSVAAVVLAAGMGTRMGGPTAKPLVPFRGRPLVAHALDAATASGLVPVALVVGNDADAVAALAPPGVRVVVNHRYAEGIGTSLVAVLEALEADDAVSAVCVGLADQPLVGPDAYRRLATAHYDGADLAVATYGGQRANPVLVGRSHWAEARTLAGDAGARILLARHAVVEVPCDGTGDPTDIDTPDELSSLERACGSRTTSG